MIKFLSSCFILIFQFFSYGVPEDLDILIVGAGPAGLSLACACERDKLSYMVVEQNAAPTKLSKATGLHPNTMRYLEQLSVVEDILKEGCLLNENFILENGTLIKHIVFNHGQQPHEKNLSIAQSVLESILSSRIPKHRILYGTKLEAFSQGATINTTLASLDGGTLEVSCKFLIGADGGKSVVRHILGIPFPGTTTKELAFSFDVFLENPDSLKKESMYMFASEIGRVVFVPITKDHQYKISGQLPLDVVSPDLDYLEEIVFGRSGLRVKKDTVSNLTLYHTSSRLAETFQRENVFLMGDAAHLFYPAGGYGLNIAIDDAGYLSHALLRRLKHDDASFLGNYTQSRRAFAEKVQKDAIAKRDQSMNSKQEKTREKQVYEERPV